MKSRFVCLNIFLLVICVSGLVFAQDTASITGTVTDPSGAAVANAQVIQRARAGHQPPDDDE